MIEESALWHTTSYLAYQLIECLIQQIEQCLQAH